MKNLPGSPGIFFHFATKTIPKVIFNLCKSSCFEDAPSFDINYYHCSLSGRESKKKREKDEDEQPQLDSCQAREPVCRAMTHHLSGRGRFTWKRLILCFLLDQELGSKWDRVNSSPSELQTYLPCPFIITEWFQDFFFEILAKMGRDKGSRLKSPESKSHTLV